MNKGRIIYIVVISFIWGSMFLGSFSTKAQSKKLFDALFKKKAPPSPKNELDKTYTPKLNSPFNSYDKFDKNSDDGSYIHAIKIYPNLVFRGILALSYERAITEVISLQGGIGITAGIDQFQFAFRNSNPTNTTSVPNELSLYTMLTTGQYNGTGIFLSGSPRFSFHSIMFQNPAFIELNYRFYTFKVNLTPNGVSSVKNIYDIKGISISSSRFNIIYGLKFPTSGQIKCTHEIYGGAGIHTLYYPVFINDSNYSSKYYKTERMAKATFASIVIGYSLGIRWP